MTTKPKKLRMKRAVIRTITPSPDDNQTHERDVNGFVDSTGCFGIHRYRSIYDSLARWSVTHVPTKRGAGHFRTSTQCRAYVTKLLAMIDIDWTKSDVSYYDTPSIAARAREAYQSIYPPERAERIRPMATVTITIKTDNAAFQSPHGPPHFLATGYEIGRILRVMADGFYANGSADNPRDANGNTVGSIEISSD